jgi:hypothetical protein
MCCNENLKREIDPEWAKNVRKMRRQAVAVWNSKRQIWPSSSPVANRKGELKEDFAFKIGYYNCKQRRVFGRKIEKFIIF